ncbi:MAG: hypothetical protein RLZZ401_243 [Pseudomonadota bacterium]|jgi:hypothetical protein
MYAIIVGSPLRFARLLIAKPDAYPSHHWPPVTALPALLGRALLAYGVRLGRSLLGGWRAWIAQANNRRLLKVLPFVLLGHLLLVWLLVQNRWLVMSETTVFIHLPISATVVLEPGAPGADSSAAGRRGLTLAPDGIALKSDSRLSLDSLHAHSSVPWFTTRQLPELRGHADGLATKAGQARTRKPVPQTTQTRARYDAVPEPLLMIPPPDAAPAAGLALIPPPPPPRAVEPLAGDPRDIPSLWPAPSAPPLNLIAPTPTPAPPVPAPVPIQPAAPRVAAQVVPSPKVAEPAPAKPAPELAPTPPLVLAPAPQLTPPSDSVPKLPLVGPVTLTPSPDNAARSPMVVEVPRYKIVDTRSSSNATNADPGLGDAGAPEVGKGPAGGRSGSDVSSGSVLGLGVPAAPPPLPATSAPKAIQQLNLSLPRVEVNKPYGQGPIRQPSLSELANAQLRRGGAKDPMAEAVNSAENPDCLQPDKSGLLAAPVLAYKALTGKCK